MRFALGRLKLKPWEFWELTWVEYYYMREGYYQEREEEWLHTRWIGSILVNINRDRKKPMVMPSDLVPLSFDKVEKPSIKGRKGTKENPFTKEELEALKRRHLKDLNLN